MNEDKTIRNEEQLKRYLEKTKDIKPEPKPRIVALPSGQKGIFTYTYEYPNCPGNLRRIQCSYEKILIGENDIPGVKFNSDFNSLSPWTLGALEKTGYIPAPMHLLVEDFPYNDCKIASNSFDFIGIDTAGKYTKKGKSVIITVHGGRDGWILPLAKTKEYVNPIERNRPRVKLHQETIDHLLQGVGPEGMSISIEHYEDRLKNPPLDLIQKMQSFGTVRPIELARKTEDRTLHSINDLTDKNGEVSDPQLITYCGTKKHANDLIERIKKRPFRWKNLGLDPNGRFENDFNPEQAQAYQIVMNDVEPHNALERGGGHLNHFYRFGFENSHPIIGIKPESTAEKK